MWGIPMRPVATITLLTVGGCAESRPVPTALAPPPPSLLIEPPGGGPDYIEYNTTISGSGGLPGWVKPGESHSRNLKEIYRWNYSQGYWQVENAFQTAEHQFSGFVQSPSVDVAYSLKRRTSYTATSRSGPTLSATSQPPIDLVQQGTTAFAAPITPLSAHTSGSSLAQGAGRADAPSFLEADVRAARFDRAVTSPLGKQRELASLHRQFGQSVRSSDGRLEFKKSVGASELRVQFDPTIGAVTRLSAYERQIRRVEVTRRYRQQSGSWVLRSIETETFDSTGKSIARFAHDLTDVVIR